MISKATRRVTPRVLSKVMVLEVMVLEVMVLEVMVQMVIVMAPRREESRQMVTVMAQDNGSWQ